MNFWHNLKSRIVSLDRLVFIALVALVLAALLPPIPQDRPVYNFQLTFDISQSMNVKDVFVDGNAASRLDFSKAAARQLLQSLPCGSRIGWSLFTERRAVALITPLDVCKHYHGLFTSLSYIDNNMRWAEASGIGKSLHQSMRAADAIGDDTQIIFMTDGHEAPPLRKGNRGMPNSDSLDVQGLIIGVGDTIPSPIPKLDRYGKTIGYWQADEVIQSSLSVSGSKHEELSARHDTHLIKLGRLAKLRYAPIDSPEQLAQLAINPNHAKREKTPVSLNWIPACLALLFLCLRFRPTGFF